MIRFRLIFKQSSSLQASLDLGYPVLCGRPAVGAQHVVPLDRLELEEAPVLGFFRGSRCRGRFNDPGDFGEVDVSATLEVLPRVVVAQLVLGRVEDEPALLPTLDPEICLEKTKPIIVQAKL